MSTAKLRDAILAALSKVPGKRIFHLHVLVSSPRRHGGLFPFSLPRPRTSRQDVVILLSEQPTVDAPRVLVAAVEAAVYSIPSTDCAILYISKVDSSGHATAPSPTSVLVRALLLHYADPETRPVSAKHLWIHLFARAQGQYLFANSADFPGKQPLSDVRLCAWWQRVLSRVAEELEARVREPKTIKLYYVLPGMNELEAFSTLNIASSNSQNPPGAFTHAWMYNHPYSQADIPLPCPKPPEGHHNLGNFIPYFDDDPKSRFMDEIAYTTDKEGIKSPAPKRQRKNPRQKLHQEADEGVPSSIDVGHGERRGKDEEDKKEKDGKPLGELGKVSPDEFWERMSFRQECIAGAVTGFFTLAVSTFAALINAPPESASLSTAGSSAVSAVGHIELAGTSACNVGHVSSQLTKRIMTSLLTAVEFSTVDRAVRATETLESAIKGLCEGISSTGKPISVVGSTAASSQNTVPLTVHAPRPRAAGASDEAVTPSPPRTPSPRPQRLRRISHFDDNETESEAVASLETYHLHIYGSVSVDNPMPIEITSVDAKATTTAARSQKPVSSAGIPVPVTVLQVRRKKKRGD